MEDLPQDPADKHLQNSTCSALRLPLQLQVWAAAMVSQGASLSLHSDLSATSAQQSDAISVYIGSLLKTLF